MCNGNRCICFDVDADERDETIAKLTAERDELTERNLLHRGNIVGLSNELERARNDIAKLTAERDDLLVLLREVSDSDIEGHDQYGDIECCIERDTWDAIQERCGR